MAAGCGVVRGRGGDCVSGIVADLSGSALSERRIGRVRGGRGLDGGYRVSWEYRVPSTEKNLKQIAPLLASLARRNDNTLRLTMLAAACLFPDAWLRGHMRLRVDRE